jgi:hypothetical protein
MEIVKEQSVNATSIERLADAQPARTATKGESTSSPTASKNRLPAPLSPTPSGDRLPVILRAGLVAIGLYIALAIGAPWLLYEAPPSAEDVLVSCKTGGRPMVARSAGELAEQTTRCRG